MSAKLTPAACRAARALLGWSTHKLAEAAGVSSTTVNAIENSKAFRAGSEDKIKAALAEHGVDITNGDGTGARLRFVEARAHRLDSGEWGVATRWEHGAPLEVVPVEVARSAAEQARQAGDRYLAAALEAAAAEAAQGD